MRFYLRKDSNIISYPLVQSKPEGLCLNVANGYLSLTSDNSEAYEAPRLVLTKDGISYYVKKTSPEALNAINFNLTGRYIIPAGNGLEFNL